MKRICAWCKKDLGHLDEPSNCITHGICPECALGFKTKEIPLQNFINSISQPILVVDWDARVETANEAYVQAMGKSIPQMERKTAGQIIGCEIAKTEEGCGQHILCLDCKVRQAITHTYQTGESLTGVRSCYRVSHEDGTVSDIQLVVSVEKMGEYILVRLDRVSPMG